jgi:hypothetical protein
LLTGRASPELAIDPDNTTEFNSAADQEHT